ncbi:DnaB-like helicase C-terminal domain-containing protein [Pseudomonas aeruginosa]
MTTTGRASHLRWPRPRGALVHLRRSQRDRQPDPQHRAAVDASTAGRIVVDYLGLIPPEAKGRTRSEEVGKTNKPLLRLAKELGVPVIELAQLNRDSTKRPGKRPQSSDLRRPRGRSRPTPVAS